jgi:hypothetical protein
LSEEQAKKVKDLKARQNKECSSYHQLDGMKLMLKNEIQHFAKSLRRQREVIIRMRS